jgi:hypothetical protein
MAGVHPDLQEAIDFHQAIVAEGGKALVGYETPKALRNVVLMSEIRRPTTRTSTPGQRRNLLLRGVPGVGKTSSASSWPPSATRSSRASRAGPTSSPPRSSVSR